MVIAFIGTVLYGLLGRNHLYTAAGIFIGYLLVIQTTGWIWASLRVGTKGVPRRLLWLLPGMMIPLRFLGSSMSSPLRGVLAPFRGGAWASVIIWLIVVWLAAWVLLALASTRINMITIAAPSQSQAELKLPGVWMGISGAADVQREIKQRQRMRTKRPRGHLRDWRWPWWEVSRFWVSNLRMPSQMLYLLGTGLLFRSALLAVFPAPRITASMLWLYYAYRVRRGGIATWYRYDTDVPFLRQFWPDTAMGRYLRATAMPLLVVIAVSFIAWIALPLSAPLTALHILFWLGLIVTWYLYEGPAFGALGAGERRLGGHEAAVIATGVMLLLGAKPALALIIPLVGMGRLVQLLMRRSHQPSPTAD